MSEPTILAEIRKLPEHRKLRRFRNFTAERVERFLEEVLKLAELVPTPPSEFIYSRDPDDAHYVDLAISTGALLVVSNDKDLLDLMLDGNADGKRSGPATPNCAFSRRLSFSLICWRPPIRAISPRCGRFGNAS